MTRRVFHTFIIFLGLSTTCRAMANTVDAQCTHDTYAHVPSQPRVASAAAPPCLEGQGVWETFDQRKLWTTLRWYANYSDFNSFRGYEFYPKRYLDYNSAYQVLFSDRSSQGPKKMEGTTVGLRSCHIEVKDGSKWSVQKVGPFRSTGGYDWWQVSWSDLGQFTDILKEHPSGVYLLSTFFRPVNARGEDLGYPPIHIHHVHVSRVGRSIKFRNDYNADFQYAVSEWLFEGHGDYQCHDADGGMSCFYEELDGYGKLIDFPLHIEGEFNDVRPVASEPMEWWIEVSFRWIPASKVSSSRTKPVSVHIFGGRGTNDFSIQQSLVLTWDMKFDQPYLFWYSGHMVTGGDLLVNKLHAHSRSFKSAFFFSATPRDLGLQDARFQPMIVKKGSGKVNYGTAMKAAGFESQGQFEDFLFHNLIKAIHAYDIACAGPKSSRSNPLCSRPRPALICQSWKDDEEVDGWVFDRRPPTCCKDWSFLKDEAYIAVGIYGWDGRPNLPIGSNTIPPFFPEHLSWIMRYVRADGKSSVTSSHSGTLGVERRHGVVQFVSDSVPVGRKQWSNYLRGNADELGSKPISYKIIGSAPDDSHLLELPRAERHAVLAQLTTADHSPWPDEMYHFRMTLLVPLLVTGAAMCICFYRGKQPSQEGPCVAISPSLRSKCLWYHASLVPCVVLPLVIANSFGHKRHMKRAKEQTGRAS
mmetsp:Transcript_105642/g.235861  ORF Transcript_105642/g.235861 Transcript_105642/m.235861 type:complete len:697 (+) Transcript_105642:1-2091(+)